MRKTMTDGCRIALADGATKLVTYREWNENEVRPLYGQRKNAAAHWIAELYLGRWRLLCQHSWDEKKKKRTTLAYVRRKCAELLDEIAPGWQIVDASNNIMSDRRRRRDDEQNL